MAFKTRKDISESGNSARFSAKVKSFVEKPPYWPKNVSFNNNVRLVRNARIGTFRDNHRYALGHLYSYTYYRKMSRVDFIAIIVREFFDAYAYDLIEKQMPLQDFEVEKPKKVPRLNDDGFVIWPKDIPFNAEPDHSKDDPAYGPKSLHLRVANFRDDASFMLEHLNQYVYEPIKYKNPRSGSKKGDRNPKMRTAVFKAALMYFFLQHGNEIWQKE